MLTGKTIGNLTQLSQITPNTLFPVELSGNTYNTSFSKMTSSLATTGSNTFKGTQTITGSVVGAADVILYLTNSGSFNTLDIESNYSGYTQINIKNNSSLTGSSTDIVATADNGDENLHYIDLGINSSNYNGGYNVGYSNDGYLLNAGRNLYIGSINTSDSNSHVHIFTRNNWKSSSISIYNDDTIGFNIDKSNNNANTIPSSVSGFTYEFSGSVKMNNNLGVFGNLSVDRGVFINARSGDEGGQINLATAPNSVLTGSVNIDVYNNKIRFWEGGGSARGAYIDLSTLDPLAGTNLLGSSGSSGSSGTSGESYNQSLNTGNTVTFDTVWTTNNGNGTNFKIGDDAWIGDVNLGNGFQVSGVEDSAYGYIKFGDNTHGSTVIGNDDSGNFSIHNTTNITGSLLVSSDITTNGQIFVNGNGGDEGGQINLSLAQTGTVLTGSINIDVKNNKLRFFEGGGTNRGGYFDLSTLDPNSETDLRGISLTQLKQIVANSSTWGDFQVAIAAL